MNFNEYTFIYKDTMKKYRKATNPVFIAENKCKAIKTELIKQNFNNVNKLLNRLNDFQDHADADIFASQIGLKEL